MSPTTPGPTPSPSSGPVPDPMPDAMPARREAFKPIAIRAPGENRALFALRCMVDLQLLTTYRFLRRELARCRGDVLDVGAGQSPWRELLQGCRYTGLDVDSADAFGMRRMPDIVYYDGGTMPLADHSFDHVLCAEVLEHVPDEHLLLTEIARVLRPGGTLVLTLPWSARLHHLPHDYRRLTPAGLQRLISAHGLQVQRLEPRGNDVAVIANKLIVVLIRLLRPRPWRHAVWGWPLAVPVAVAAVVALIAAHASMALGRGSPDDPLGYALVAVRR